MKGSKRRQILHRFKLFYQGSRISDVEAGSQPSLCPLLALAYPWPPPTLDLYPPMAPAYPWSPPTLGLCPPMAPLAHAHHSLCSPTALTPVSTHPGSLPTLDLCPPQYLPTPNLYPPLDPVHHWHTPTPTSAHPWPLPTPGLCPLLVPDHPSLCLPLVPAHPWSLLSGLCLGLDCNLPSCETWWETTGSDPVA